LGEEAGEMLYVTLKTALTALIIVAVSELAKRSTAFAGLLASLPVMSVFALTWLYVDTRDTVQVAALSRSILLMILPSLLFLVVLPAALKAGASFPLALVVAIAVTAAAYWLWLVALKQVGITL
jgi:hypothetical protein